MARRRPSLAASLPRVLDASVPDIVLYQAGVDRHRDDRLERLALSDAGLDARDRLALREVRRRGLPAAAAHSGGSGHDPLVIARCHARSMLACAREYERHPAPRLLAAEA